MDTRHKWVPKKTKQKIYISKDSYFVSLDEYYILVSQTLKGLKLSKHQPKTIKIEQ